MRYHHLTLAKLGAYTLQVTSILSNGLIFTPVLPGTYGSSNVFAPRLASCSVSCLPPGASGTGAVVWPLAAPVGEGVTACWPPPECLGTNANVRPSPINNAATPAASPSHRRLRTGLLMKINKNSAK